MSQGTEQRLRAWFDDVARPAVACSGGIDSLLLATIANRVTPATLVVHSVTAAVPSAATVRVLRAADAERWHLRVVRSREFDDVRYLRNPRNRCYFCKTHLYSAMRELHAVAGERHTLLSGANLDDLAEYRPGLVAAAEHEVRHPYVELGIAKQDIRWLARDLGLGFAELPASPCLASRLYVGTEVTPSRLRAVEIGEEMLTARTGIVVVRCRISGDSVRVEVQEADHDHVSTAVLREVLIAMRTVDNSLCDITLDPHPYRPGRALDAEAVG